MTSGGRKQLTVGLFANLLSAAMSLLVPALAMFALCRSARDDTMGGLWASLRASPFLESLTPSAAFAVFVGGIATLIAYGLSPALNSSAKSSTLRLWGLAIALFAPPVLLVLLGAEIVTVTPNSQQAVFIIAQVLATYPAVALLASIAIEPILKSVVYASRLSNMSTFARFGLAVRVSHHQLFALIAFGSAVALQNYLINLDLRQDPTLDALIAMRALFPNTGVTWDTAMLACLIVWSSYIALATVAVSVFRNRT